MEVVSTLKLCTSNVVNGRAAMNLFIVKMRSAVDNFSKRFIL